MDEKISQLDNYTPPTDTDVFPIVDVANGITKKITFANLKSEITGDDTAFVRKAEYDANSILYATADNTPLALTVGTNSVVGRVAGAITTLAVDNDLSSVSANDDTVPSAKATKTALDLKAPLTSPTFATSINGSYLTASEILITDGSKNIVSAAVATYPSLTELTYLKGVTSAIQTQLNSKISAGTQVVAIPRPLMPYSGAGTRALNNNVDGYVHLFSLDKQIIVNKITINVTAVGASGTINIGVFSADGQTRHISVTTGTISGTGLVTTSVSAVTLPAGNYLLLLGSVSTADISVSQWTALSPISAFRAVSGEPTICGTYTVTASTMPATLTLASISSGTDGAFAFRLDN